MYCSFLLTPNTNNPPRRHGSHCFFCFLSWRAERKKKSCRSPRPIGVNESAEQGCQAIALMHAQTEKLKLALSSHCLQSVKTNRLPEDPISVSISWGWVEDEERSRRLPLSRHGPAVWKLKSAPIPSSRFSSSSFHRYIRPTATSLHSEVTWVTGVTGTPLCRLADGTQVVPESPKCM